MFFTVWLITDSYEVYSFLWVLSFTHRRGFLREVYLMCFIPSLWRNLSIVRLQPCVVLAVTPKLIKPRWWDILKVWKWVSSLLQGWSFAHDVMKLNSMSLFIGFEIFLAHSRYRTVGLSSASICVKETRLKAYSWHAKYCLNCCVEHGWLFISVMDNVALLKCFQTSYEFEHKLK